LKAALGAATVDARGGDARLAGEMKVDVVAAATAVTAAVLDAAGKGRAAAGRQRSANNLKQIGLALHNWHATNGRLPPAATYSPDGKPLLSWRVLILPFLDQQGLYKEFRLDEPWDSDHNKKLLAKMPRVYETPDARAAPGETHYQSFFGKAAFFE